MIDFLIGAAIRRCAIIRKAMGKGNGVDERHGKEKRPARRLAMNNALVNP
jgi:hypothetical protein